LKIAKHIWRATLAICFPFLDSEKLPSGLPVSAGVIQVLLQPTIMPIAPWFEHVAWNDGYPSKSPVRKFKPNRNGLYDLHGNAREWCSD
jgi:hypothetical protein